MKYVHKPIEVDAIQYNVDNKKDIFAFTKGDVLSGSILGCSIGLIIDKGDWIIRELNGKLYLCTPEMFEKMYQRIDK
jgi:hypothetical protein